MSTHIAKYCKGYSIENFKMRRLEASYFSFIKQKNTVYTKISFINIFQLTQKKQIY